jgi:hypothetical protein
MSRVNVAKAAVGSIAVAFSSCAVMLLGLGGVVNAHAAPTGDDSEPSCVYTLSTPFVVEVSGVKMVSATLKALPCTGDILPNTQTVCVELKGGGVAPQCQHKAGYATAQVYFAPYRAGSTYVSTGTGCGSIGPMFVSRCATQGPYAATL